MAKPSSETASGMNHQIKQEIKKKRVRPPAQSGRYPRGKRAGTWMPRVQAIDQCQHCVKLKLELEVSRQKCLQLESALQSSNQRCWQLAAAMGAANQKAAQSGAPCVIVRAVPTTWTSSVEDHMKKI